MNYLNFTKSDSGKKVNTIKTQESSSNTYGLYRLNTDKNYIVLT